MDADGGCDWLIAEKRRWVERLVQDSVIKKASLKIPPHLLQYIILIIIFFYIFTNIYFMSAYIKRTPALFYGYDYYIYNLFNLLYIHMAERITVCMQWIFIFYGEHTISVENIYSLVIYVCVYIRLIPDRIYFIMSILLYMLTFNLLPLSNLYKNL